MICSAQRNITEWTQNPSVSTHGIIYSDAASCKSENRKRREKNEKKKHPLAGTIKTQDTPPIPKAPKIKKRTPPDIPLYSSSTPNLAKLSPLLLPSHKHIVGTVPSSSRASPSAPLSNSSSVTAPFPPHAALCSGVRPFPSLV